MHAVELKVLETPSIFLDWYIEDKGQGGWKVEWERAYKSEKELLDSNGEMVVMDSKTGSAKTILKLWHINKKILRD